MLKSVFLGWMEHSWRRLILEDSRDHISHLGRRANPPAIPTVDPFVNTALILTLSLCVFFLFFISHFCFSTAGYKESLHGGTPSFSQLSFLFFFFFSLTAKWRMSTQQPGQILHLPPPSCALCSAKINTRRPALPNMKTHTLPVVDI